MTQNRSDTLPRAAALSHALALNEGLQCLFGAEHLKAIALLSDCHGLRCTLFDVMLI
ncbi:hypothetical protein BOSE62_50273 [Bosea sp. 62]|nr:hypothetical protein BOSE21B_100280 [Bosea sp. 21B]CAD5284636.1 hypothetical protein BOSE7B_41250 [Bosea sp. 7B]CAD5301683.1 hypothetical protein BOSE46_90646 [Bosea sp. 46]VVT57802.1 hypothetical protein BOS5A_200279 [Bosea sp. EC-HK365B]VXB31644.1 hypothetical protein BOSE29B_100087 [Bosea sp. 29B]VXB75487.1 hypothetical protein BOSE125_150087 [Bosea sp. 125]VXC62882.1 hypothetical protein BOSE62_50273 [Bosea sp. 62]VXC91836.1 hypothetical protein BOSE127_80034 [Bosea sp. 127]